MQSYNEVVEQLRRQHAINTNEVYGRGGAGNGYNVYTERYRDSRKNDNFFFTFKILLFLVCVMGFSLYIYGEQDVSKGFSMACQDMKETVEKLEDEEPMVKEAMGYCRKGYHFVKEAIEAYDE